MIGLVGVTFALLEDTKELHKECRGLLNKLAACRQVACPKAEVEKVESQQKLLDSLKEVNHNRQEEKRKRYDKNVKGIEEVKSNHIKLQDEITILEEQMEDVELQKKFVRKLRQGQADKKSELKLIANNLKFFKSHDQCPTCTQSISTTFKTIKLIL